MPNARAFLLIAWLSLGGCTLLPSSPPSTPALLPPASLGQSLQASQQLQAFFGQEQQQLLIALAVDEQQLRVTGLTPNGQRLLTIAYDGEHTQTEGDQWLPEELDPTLILTQLQLAYWPLATLQNHYSAPWSLSESEHQRQLLLDQIPVVTIDYLTHKPTDGIVAGNRISLYDHWFDITLNIRTLTVHTQANE